MAKTGRNDPCHCGSGKKYKRCCLQKDEAVAATAAEAAREAERIRTRNMLNILTEMDDDGADLDQASNAVVAMVHAGKLDEAEAAAHDLLARFPEVHDGYDRLGMVAEARGDKKLAATYYRKVVEFAQQHADRYDPGLAANFQKWADELDPPTTT
jgi:tetratricopeptide (TPR) repeat protein